MASALAQQAMGKADTNFFAYFTLLGTSNAVALVGAETPGAPYVAFLFSALCALGIRNNWRAFTKALHVGMRSRGQDRAQDLFMPLGEVRPAISPLSAYRLGFAICLLFSAYWVSVALLRPPFPPGAAAIPSFLLAVALYESWRGREDWEKPLGTQQAKNILRHWRVAVSVMLLCSLVVALQLLAPIPHLPSVQAAVAGLVAYGHPDPSFKIHALLSQSRTAESGTPDTTEAAPAASAGPSR